MIVPIIDIEKFLVGRECEAVRASQIFTHQRDVPVFRCEDAAERQFFAWIFEKLGQTKWRIGKIKRSITAINKIVGTVESLAFKFVRQDVELTVTLKPDNAAISVLVHG